ncbi:MAG: hypothetical protein ACYC48_00180 [Minisyncoccota bacterium]
MRHTRLWIIATIIAGIILISFALSVPHTRDIVDSSAATHPTPSAPSVALHDAFKKGLHTITGSVKAPDLCTSLTATSTLSSASSTAPHILVTISMPEDTGVCLQQTSDLTFSTTITAPSDLPITVLVNGSVATTTNL